MAETEELPSAVDELKRALGELVLASGYMEARLRYLVAELAGSDDAGWIIFEGQSVDWLVSNGKAVLGENREVGLWPAETYDRVEQAFNKVVDLARQRNFMIHGVWRGTCLGCDCEPRPPKAPEDVRIFHVSRSRHRKGSENRLLAVSDVSGLARRVGDLANEFRTITADNHAYWLSRGAEKEESATAY